MNKVWILGFVVVATLLGCGGSGGGGGTTGGDPPPDNGTEISQAPVGFYEGTINGTQTCTLEVVDNGNGLPSGTVRLKLASSSSWLPGTLTSGASRILNVWTCTDQPVSIKEFNDRYRISALGNNGFIIINVSLLK